MHKILLLKNIEQFPLVLKQNNNADLIELIKQEQSSLVQSVSEIANKPRIVLVAFICYGNLAWQYLHKFIR
ncbi:hypothetical protein [Legionella nagasakiensis]|uniref:hypothetical protein n=1 Tax=Legionella nagasakiensis TaxID=535290 RepID=UPI001055FA3B|nr:hypothetical protein [Legionella nagasakiensis]